MKGKVKVIFFAYFSNQRNECIDNATHAAREIQIKKSINFILFSASLRIVN